jgi:hypothetical protein
MRPKGRLARRRRRPSVTAARSLSVVASLLRPAGVLSFMIEQLFVRVSALVVVRA